MYYGHSSRIQQIIQMIPNQIPTTQYFEKEGMFKYCFILKNILY